MFLFSSKMCANCIHHRAGDSPFTGTCANRSWQPTGGVIRLVRENELACYGGWGVDNFEARQPGDDGDSTGGGSNPGGGSNGTRGTIGPGGRYVAQAGGRVLSPELVDKLLAVSPGRNAGRDQLPLWDDDVN